MGDHKQRDDSRHEVLPEGNRRSGDVLSQVDVRAFLHQIRQRGKQWRQKENGQQKQCPGPGRLQRSPACEKKKSRCRSKQAAPQIVEQFPAGEQCQGIALFAALVLRPGVWNKRKQPFQQLPIPPDPAVTPFDVGQITRRVLFIQLPVAHKARAGITALDQVVAQDTVFRQTFVQRLVNDSDVVYTFPDEGTFAENILINI